MKNVFLLMGLAALTLTTACKKDDNNTPAAMQLAGTMSASTEVPAVKVASTGTGSVTGTFDQSTMVLNYTITYSNLTANPSAGHFHFGDAKHSGGVFVVFPALPAATSGTVSGSATLTAMQADSFKLGHVYSNLHTANNPGGEVRANVTLK
ncbi:CHRD domain-containing protein [Hymenobacter ginsengisoli]|uniref:CHRD domain-containing protein n=1 Tax=Hymenobacter ginsengisoli TaxID=1051626 RepID=A0ABP8QRZ3_9BACT|nr:MULTISPECIES: CHRD domain-containing protein [unclassified Hymenobacter]MBO2032785.1 CHRD domain-containing protein [Hymenobacter sp. BT559]